MREMALHRWPELVGLPVIDRGRSRAGVDCWGLVRLAFAELAGIDLPSYAGDYLSSAEMAEIDGLIGAAKSSPSWQCIAPADARAMDVVLFRRGRFDAHVGLVVDPRRQLMLHAAERHGTRAETWTGARWAPRLAGFWRHRELIS